MTERLDLPQLFVGDLMQALRKLRPKDAATRAAMLEMLQLTTAEPQAAAAVAPQATAVAQEKPAAAPIAEEEEELEEEETDAEEEHQLATQAAAADAAASAAEMARSAVPWARKRRLLPMRIETIRAAEDKPFVAPTIPSATDEEHEAPPELLPLLEPAWTRAVLTAAVASEVPEGEIDLDELVEQIARGRMPSELPRHSAWSMRGGVQLLVDCGAGMVPFARDVESLTATLRTLATAELTRVLRFRGGPWEGVFDVAARENVPYEPPPRGTPVVLVTDLGISRHPFSSDAAPPAAWRGFLAALRDLRRDVIVLVPYPRERWPAAVAEVVTAVHWDRRTTVAHVHAARGRRRSR